MTIKIDSHDLGMVWVSRTNLLEELSYPWGKLFTVQVALTVTSLPADGTTWLNIFHFTTGQNYRVEGNIIPALWIYVPTATFFISSAVNGDKDHWIEEPLTLGTRLNVTIEQIFDSDGKVIYRIVINEASVYSIENHANKDFENVKVYLSDPWYSSFKSYGIVHDFSWSTGNHFAWSS